MNPISTINQLLIAAFIAASLSCKPSAPAEEKMKGNADIVVRGNCDMCKERIEEVALGLPGIKTATWDVDTKHLILDMDTSKTSLQALHSKLAEAGHGTTMAEATDAANKALPPCCRKGADMH